jgi:hypothetical protein
MLGSKRSFLLCQFGLPKDSLFFLKEYQVYDDVDGTGLLLLLCLRLSIHLVVDLSVSGRPGCVGFLGS